MDQLPFSKTVFKNMMKIATQSLFIYDGTLYKQIDGVSMGSPVGPTLANFFMATLEKKILGKENTGRQKAARGVVYGDARWHIVKS